jgi:hypothetical protein
MQPDLTDRDNDSGETRAATMVRMPKNPPESMQHHLRVRLNEHAKTRWPALKRVEVRFRAGFAYVDGIETGGQVLKLCRLRFYGALHTWGFAIYLASRDGYEDNFLPSGRPSGSPEEALDCACGLYLGDPTAWITKPSTD